MSVFVDNEDGVGEDMAMRSFIEAESKAIQSGRVLVITNISKWPNIIQLGILALAHDFCCVIVGMPKIETEDLVAKKVSVCNEIFLFNIMLKSLTLEYKQC
jgi:hypothetical protein